MSGALPDWANEALFAAATQVTVTADQVRENDYAPIFGRATPATRVTWVTDDTIWVGGRIPMARTNEYVTVLRPPAHGLPDLSFELWFAPHFGGVIVQALQDIDEPCRDLVGDIATRRVGFHIDFILEDA